MKIFTVEEANALLPTVRKKLIKIKAYQQRLSAHHQPAKTAAEAGEQGGGGIPNGVHYAKLLLGLTDAISDLETLGVQIKDFERGLVDFPSLREGRVVLLCWQLGDGDEVEWWHDVDAGFAGRTPL